MDDQSDDRDPLHRDERDRIPEPGEDVRRDCGRGQKECRAGNREPLDQAPPEEGEREPRRDDEYHLREDRDLVHRSGL